MIAGFIEFSSQSVNNHETTFKKLYDKGLLAYGNV